MAHHKAFYRHINGKTVYVAEGGEGQGRPAELHERTAIGKHKSGTHYLRASDAEDGKKIEAAAKHLGINTEKRRTGASHFGRVGAYDHFHVSSLEDASKIHEHLKGGEAHEYHKKLAETHHGEVSRFEAKASEKTEEAKDEVDLSDANSGINEQGGYQSSSKKAEAQTTIADKEGTHEAHRKAGVLHSWASAQALTAGSQKKGDYHGTKAREHHRKADIAKYEAHEKFVSESMHKVAPDAGGGKEDDPRTKSIKASKRAGEADAKMPAYHVRDEDYLNASVAHEAAYHAHRDAYDATGDAEHAKKASYHFSTAYGGSEPGRGLAGHAKWASEKAEEAGAHADEKGDFRSHALAANAHALAAGASSNIAHATTGDEQKGHKAKRLDHEAKSHSYADKKFKAYESEPKGDGKTTETLATSKPKVGPKKPLSSFRPKHEYEDRKAHEGKILNEMAGIPKGLGEKSGSAMLASDVALSHTARAESQKGHMIAADKHLQAASRHNKAAAELKGTEHGLWVAKHEAVAANHQKAAKWHTDAGGDDSDQSRGITKAQIEHEDAAARLMAESNVAAQVQRIDQQIGEMGGDKIAIEALGIRRRHLTEALGAVPSIEQA